ncbi:transcription elongation factor GreA [Nocardioides euryhalodurans]|uniref:Transcription elongation factor GreA n=1 Tax=Nocardioides euryhalodurans TaxID=2518370 RepID=A0A4P7GPA2_9ACTN|nr:transcription elongation factor GreA [Nocardioides euryhalodurans]QBR93611.1 transcription elongation factor GreA [Nocardioides euryhalodurans]
MTQSAQPTSVWLTKKTFDRLSAELEDLRGPRRHEVIERISAARDEGDLKENGGYHAAKDEQGKIEASIRQLEEMLETADTDAAADDGVVTPGKLVTYRFAGDDEDAKFLMGAREIEDDYEDQDLEVFSPQSPLGAALIGASKGETVQFEAPNGRTQRIEIVDAVPFTD